MTEFLNNPWVTGIGGGIISSLIVFFVTRVFFRKRENREYLQKLETANNEILYSIRPLVVEKKIPDDETLSSIKTSTAQKYGVNEKDLYDEFSLANDLINEIMSNSFLSTDQKMEFCQLLKGLKRDEEQEGKEHKVVYLNRKDPPNTRYNSMLLAIMSFGMVLTMTFYITQTTGQSFLFDKFSVLIISTLTPIVAMVILYTLIYLRRKEKFLMEKRREREHMEK